MTDTTVLNATERLLSRLSLLVEKGALRAIDYQFARYMSAQFFQCRQDDASMQCGQSDQDNPNVATLTLWAAQLSYRAGQGNICVAIDQFQVWFDLNSQDRQWLLADIEWTDIHDALSDSPAVGNGLVPTPMVVAENRLYLARYWHDEQIVARYLRRHAVSASTSQALPDILTSLFIPYLPVLKARLQSNDDIALKRQSVIDVLDIVNPEALPWGDIDLIIDAQPGISALNNMLAVIPLSSCLNWQKVAAAMSLSRQFSVISGGPGTGKTTTVVRLLAAWIEQAKFDPAPEEGVPVIKLVAPTGKAAARLTESIGGALDQLAISPDIKGCIPTEASTLHRLLGAIPERVSFRHNAQNRLHLDVLVVDEASMVDLSMMARLMEALPDHARLVLLGDKDQLASVEAGSVLGDICQFAVNGYSSQQAAHLSRLTGYHIADGSPRSPISDSLCMLQKSHRFHALSGIGQLAFSVNQGNTHRVESVWQQGFGDIEHHPLTTESYISLISRLVNAYKPYFLAAKEGQKPEDVLALFADVRLLCAIRNGDTGVDGMNQRVERHLRQLNLIQDHDDLWYIGRPIMITRNDYALGLSNGDIGITLYDQENQRLRVYFQLPDGSIKGILPSRLPTHETAYAMTIHKSQGSEFGHTFLLLPAKMNPVVTRELIYTGITRAKKQLSLYADMPILLQGINRQTERLSGLKQALIN